MHSSFKAVIVFFLPLALAQYGSPAESSSTKSAAAPVSSTSSSNSGIQTVTVGAGGMLAFSPNTITAAVGSSIDFVFSPPTHSVVQGSFESPCVPLANNTGFYSGAIITSSGTNTNIFTITINDTNPIWFFCGFPTHCESGMSGVINAPSDGSSTLAQYQAAAGKVSNPPTPSVVQGGTIGPAKAAGTGSSTSSAASKSPTKSAGAKGVDTGGSAQWLVMALTGMFAIGVGSLMI